MKTDKAAHAMYMVCFRVFTECKKSGNRPISLKRLEELFPKRADYILSWMLWNMYGPGSLFHASNTQEGSSWYLKSHIYDMNAAEFQEHYKHYHNI